MRPQAHDTGFTLIELLVVLTILALLGVLLPRLTRSSPGLQVRAAAASLAADLRLLRSEAARHHVVTELVLQPEAYRLSPGGTIRRPPSQVTLSYAPAVPDMLDRAADRLRFFGDGSSSGGKIILRDGKAEASVQVAWIGGAIAVHAP